MKSPRTVGMSVIRPNQRVARQLAALELVLLATVAYLVWQEAYVFLLTAIAATVALGFWVARLFRECTEIRPEGLYNRRLGGAELLPWTDLTRVMSSELPPVVVAVHRDGRNVRLAGVLGRRPAAGPQLDEIVTAVREQLERHGTAEPATAPDVIERRLTWRPVRVPIVILTSAGLIAASVALARPWWLMLVAVPLLAAAGFLVTISTRSRTVIGLDGIRNRPFRTETFIPWADVKEVVVASSPPRSIQVVRHGARPKTLAGVRDGDVHPDQIPFDGIAELIRQRAGLDGVSDDIRKPEPVRAEAPAGPVTFRPSKRPVLWLAPLALGFVPAVYCTIDNTVFLFIAAYLVVIPWVLLGVCGRLLRGRTDAGPDGIRNRLLRAKQEIMWSELDRFVVQPTLFGRVLQVIRVKGQKRIVLAAPREGLLGRDPEFEAKVETLRALAVANGGGLAPVERHSANVTRSVYGVGLGVAVALGLYIWQPWLSSWWPTQHQATALPRACAVAHAEIARLDPGGSRVTDLHKDQHYFITSTCYVRGADRLSRLDVELKLERRTLSKSGADDAREEFAGKRSTKSPRPTSVAGLGDEAVQTVDTDKALSRVTLLIRRANVIIELTYEAERPVDQLTNELRTLAGTALQRIKVG